MSLAVAILIVGLFFIDAIEGLLHTQFEVMQRQDVTVTFAEPASASAVYELQRLPGVLSLETARNVPVDIHFGHRSRRSVITGRDLEVVDTSGLVNTPFQLGHLAQVGLATEPASPSGRRSRSSA